MYIIIIVSYLKFIFMFMTNEDIVYLKNSINTNYKLHNKEL